MGSWNKTCGLSSLHITHGTPVYVFVLEETRDNSNCYTTSLFRPLLLPFESEYNDYGGGENSSGVALPFILKGIKDQLLEMEIGENQYHDIAVKKEAFDEELFFEAAHEDRLSIVKYDKETKLQFTMFRKDVVDSILETRVVESYVGGNKGTIAKWGDSKDYIRYKFADIAASVRPMIEKLITDRGDEDMYFVFDRLHDYRDKFLAAQWLQGDGYRYSRIVDMKQLARHALSIGTLESVMKLEALMIENLKAVFIDNFMESARKTWIPGGHEGSQSTSGGALKLLGKVVNDVVDTERAKWAEENGEEETAEEEYMD